MRLNNPAALAASVLTALALLFGACGYDSDDGYGDAPAPAAARSATASPTTELTPAATSTQPATPALPPARPAAPASTPTRPAALVATATATAVPVMTSQLTLIASSVRFDVSTLIAAAGPVTIALDNRDQGIPHNIHVFKGRDASGASVGSTEIETGAVQQTLVFGDLAAGSYFYQCDVHPSRMMGTLTVS